MGEWTTAHIGIKAIEHILLTMCSLLRIMQVLRTVCVLLTVYVLRIVNILSIVCVLLIVYRLRGRSMRVVLWLHHGSIPRIRLAISTATSKLVVVGNLLRGRRSGVAGVVIAGEYGFGGHKHSPHSAWGKDGAPLGRPRFFDTQTIHGARD